MLPLRVLRRRALVGLPAVVVAALALGACHHAATPTPSPTPSTTLATPTPSASHGVPQGPAPTAQSPVSPVTGGTGSDGLTVRYLGDDGTVETVGVEDFPR